MINTFEVNFHGYNGISYGFNHKFIKCWLIIYGVVIFFYIFLEHVLNEVITIEFNDEK
jgi:hypothetical protein